MTGQERQTGQAGSPLDQAFPFWQLMRFALPSIVTMVFMGLYTVVDTLFVARLVNADGLAALNIVCPVINGIVGLGTMLATGGNAVLSRKLGGGREQEVRENFTLLALSAAVLGAAVGALGIVLLEPVIQALGASQRLAPYCRDYLRLLLAFTPASMLQVLFQNLFVTAGRPELGLWLAVGAGCANGLFDYLFLAVVPMGIAGAALGTSIGYLIPALAGCVFFARGSGTLRFCRPRLDWSVLWESCRNGCSDMVSQLAAAVTTFFFNRTMMGLAGEDGVAAITILIYSQFLLTTVYLGFSMGVAPVFGYCYGARREERMKNIFRSSMIFVAASSALVFLAAELGGGWIAALFAKENQRVYQLTKEGFPLFSLSFLFSGVNLFVSAMFTALSNGRVSALLSFCRTFVFLLAGLLILPGWLGRLGVWLAVPIAEGLTLGMSLLFLRACRSR